MQAFPAANRLAPLLALVTAACNVSDSGISSSVPQGRFAPRLVVAGNRLSQSDSVYLQLWTRSNSQAAWAPAASLGRSWSDSSIEVDSLPVGALWKASIAGVSAKDTLWKGTDSGVIAATATEQNLQDTASRVHVRNVASRPDTAGLPTSLVAGSSFTLSGTGKIVHAWGSDLPNCAGGDSGRTIVVDTAHTVLRLRVCGDTSLTWPSAVVTRKFSLLAVAPPRLSLTDSDSLLTTSPVTKMAVRAWNAAVGLVHPARTTLSWEISLDSSGQKDTSSGDSLRIPRAWLASLPATGTSFIARAFVRLKDSAGTPVDSAHVRWLVTVPVTPTPTLSHRLSQNSDTLIHTWNTHDSATFLLKTGSTLVTEELANTVTEHRAQVKPGDICLARLIAYDSVTGRRSDTARDTARVPSPPATPSFTAQNTDVMHGYVTLKVGTVNQAGTRWAYGYRDTAGGAVTYADTLAGDSAVIELNSGRWIIGVRALRDGLWRDSLCTLSVTRTLAARPGKPTGLALSGRTDTSLTWTWNSVSGRKYRIFVQKSFDNLAALSADTAPKSPAPVIDSTELASYTAKVTAGETRTIAVVALKGTADSSGGNSDPATLATTAINPPPTPSFTATPTSSATGALTVTVTNMDNCTGRVGISQGESHWTWRPLTSASWDTVGLQGNYYVAVAFARDGLESSYTLASPVTLLMTNAAVPLPPTGLKLRTQTASSLTWTWDTLPRHSYTAYYGTGTTLPTDITTKAHDASSGTFTYESLRANQSAWIAVVSSSLDSTGSSSSPAGLVSKTLNPPATISGASAKSFDGGIEVSYSRDSGTSYVLRYSIGAATPQNYHSTQSPDTLRLSAGTYTIQIIATRDGLDTSTSFSEIAVATPSQYTHKEPTGLKIVPVLKETVGDTAFDVSWDARSNDTFQLTVTQKSTSSAIIQNILGSSAHVSTTPGESYGLALKVLGDKDSANPSNAVTLDTSARKAPKAPQLNSASWDKPSTAIKVLLQSADTSVASYRLTDDSTTFTDIRTISNNWAGSGSQPELVLSSLSNTVRHGNMRIHVSAVGNNGLSSSDAVITAHIPQQRSLMSNNKAWSWTVGDTVKLSKLDTLFPEVPDTLALSCTVSPSSSSTNFTDRRGPFASKQQFNVDVGSSNAKVALSFQGRWKNGDTTIVSDPNTLGDTVTILTASSQSADTAYLGAFIVKDSSGKLSVKQPTSYKANRIHQYHTAGGWSTLGTNATSYLAGIDSVGVLVVAPRSGPSDTSERVSAAIVIDSLVDSRDRQVYPVTTLDGRTWMAKNLNYAATKAGPSAPCYNGTEFCGEQGRYYTISQAWDLASPDCDTLPFTGTDSSQVSGCKYTDITKSGENVQGICPTGWHLPADEDWKTLLVRGEDLLSGTWYTSAGGFTGSDKYAMHFVWTGNGTRLDDDPSKGSGWSFEANNSSVSRSAYWGAPSASVPPGFFYHAHAGLLSPLANRYESTSQAWYFSGLTPSGSAPSYKRIAYALRCVRD